MNNEKPIIFSAVMIKAILEGRKTQTRRIVIPQPFLNKQYSSEEPTYKEWLSMNGSHNDSVEKWVQFCPYGDVKKSWVTTYNRRSMKLENQLNELWVTIEGSAGQYEVSNLGRVRSLDMRVWSGRNHYLKKGRILKPGLGGNGYLTVSLRGVSQKVSRLVAIAFVPRIEGKEIVNHIDGNKLNNLATNLEWEDHHGNEKHAYRTGLKNSNSVRKLSKSDYAEIIQRRVRGEKFTEIHKDYQQVTISTIKRIGHIYNKTREHKHGKRF